MFTPPLVLPGFVFFYIECFHGVQASAPVADQGYLPQNTCRGPDRTCSESLEQPQLQGQSGRLLMQSVQMLSMNGTNESHGVPGTHLTELTHEESPKHAEGAHESQGDPADHPAELEREDVPAIPPSVPPHVKGAGSILHNASPDVLPVPVFVYGKKPCIGDNGSNPLIGDMFEPRCSLAKDLQHVEPRAMEHEEEIEEEIVSIHEAGAQALLIFVYIVLLGIALNHLLGRFLPFVPFTAAIFLTGFTISLLQSITRKMGWVFDPTFDSGVMLWQHANPRLMLYIFLPPLIWGEAMNLNVSMVRRCSYQCMLLAGPGVLLGTSLLGIYAKFCLPYEWDWNTSMLFASILSATDPVAVVAIFNALGVSPRLTMVLSGESLFNDGTAYLLFVLFDLMVTGVTPAPMYIVEFFLRMATIGPLVGYGISALTLAYMGLCGNGGKNAADIVGQALSTVAVAYMTYIWCEELETSAVLGVVAAGYRVAAKGWPRFISRENMHSLWHAIEFAGNTAIFALAGMLFGAVLWDNSSVIDYQDILLLGLTYVACTVIRAIVVATLWIPINYVGTPLSWQEGIVIVFSGMRGAIGLLMAVAADRNEFISNQTGARIMFHMGGMSLLMLGVNGPITPLVLRALGLTDPLQKEKVVAKYKTRIALRTNEELKAKLQNAEFKHLTGDSSITVEDVAKFLPTMKDFQAFPRMATPPGRATPRGVSPGGVADAHRDLRMRSARESYLRVVKQAYWEALDAGVMDRHRPYSLVLIDSADVALMDSQRPIMDWAIVKRALDIGMFKSKTEFARNAHLSYTTLLDFETYIQRNLEVAIAFLHVHENALAEVKSFVGCEWSEEELALHQEVEDQNQEVTAYIDSTDQGHNAEIVKSTRIRLLAGMVLKFQNRQASALAEQGLISDENAAAIEADFNKHMKSLVQLSVTDALTLMGAT